ncbi:ROK family protein [Ligilactobacillus sp. WILCCON 0076]|uniref:ROK family protein n=1 Tax=Ligilactobacillus ubinensis TaxID=2876789 RepID=A0A9X2FG07_9LACO|nr:ROK family protein [Ligilactobacillus ubinensis]MCP0885716.1 ROK family protein [Ligilactobacillus ubinensis]
MDKHLGIDVGGTFIKYGIVDDTGKVLSSSKIKTERKNPDAVVESISNLITEQTANQKIAKIGLSIPGVVSNDGTLLTAGAIEGLSGHNIINEVYEKTGRKISVINDANSSALAEHWVGAAKHYDNFVSLPLGTGVGGAIYINGKLVTGRIGAAGEFGMMLMDRGNTEPLEYESSSFYCGAVAGLCRIYSYKIGKKKMSDWELDVRKILELASEGDKIAQESLTEFYHNVAVLLLNISVSLDPELILIGGGISENPIIMTGIKKAATKISEEYSSIKNIGFPKVEACVTRNQAGLIGAVAHAIRQAEL